MPDLARVDFRLGKLTGVGGFDSVEGTGVAITESDTGVGIYAADWTSDASNYGVVSFTAADEVFAYIYLILDSAPAASQTVLQILADDSVVGEINVETDRTLTLKNNDTAIGSASSALTLGTLYRVGLRQKKGAGTDAELEGYLAEKHKALSSFASSSAESFTAGADEIRAGACDAVALDGRIGYLAADSRQMPGSWLAIHDFLLGPIGLMKPGVKAPVQVADATPAYERVAIGEARHNTYNTMSFEAMANWAGGVGQARLVAQDKFLTGIGDGRFPGYYFPPRKAQAESAGGASSWYFNRGSTLYGVNATVLDQIGTSTTVAIGTTLRSPVHQPVVDGFDNAYWASAASNYKIAKFDGSTVADVTPANFRAKHVAAFGRHIWALGERDIPDKAYVRDLGVDYTSGSSHTFSIASAPAEDDTTLSVIVVSVESTTDASLTLADTNWALAGAVPVDNGSNLFVSQHVFYQFGGGEDSKSITFNMSDSDAKVIVQFIEMAGADPDSTVNFTGATDAGTATSVAITGTGSDIQISGACSSNPSDTPSDGDATWTTVDTRKSGEFFTQFHVAALAYKLASDTTITWSNMTQAAMKTAWLLTLDETPDAGTTQFQVVATDDGGETWTAAPTNFSMTLFGTIRASVPTAEALWITSDRGLFRMVGEGAQTVGGDDIVTVGIVQADKWELPADDNAGKWIASFQGLLYYPVGAVIRRYTPNSQDPNDDRAFWPPPDWATVADQIQALVSNEAGIWFGAAGYLWCFTGRGFHQMAAEPEANAFDYLFWHQGKLYYKDDPSGYYKYVYPSVRPDILIANSDLTAADFDTGYLITSSLDFEKVADPKVIRVLESQVSFTSQDANSGTIAWHYRNGCGTDADPGVGSGGDTSSTWTAWGTHGFNDGGFDRHVLATPLQCYRVFARATLTPGSSGIPVLHFFTLWGVAKMPSLKGIVHQVALSPNQVNRENGELWGNVEQVKKALRVIDALRETDEPDEQLTVTTWINDGSDGGREYLCLFTKFDKGIVEESEDGARLDVQGVIQLEELPG